MVSPFSPGYRDRARASGPIEKGPGLDGLEATCHQKSALKRLQKNNPKTAQDKYHWTLFTYSKTISKKLRRFHG
jgi:hypothetical protein